MKIITVNLPEEYLKMIENLIGDRGLYPSRSELIRVAVREFLINELKSLDTLSYIYSNFRKPDTQPKQILSQKKENYVEPPEELLSNLNDPRKPKLLEEKELFSSYTQINSRNELNEPIIIPWQKDQQGNIIEVRTYQIIQK